MFSNLVFELYNRITSFGDFYRFNFKLGIIIVELEIFKYIN